MVTTSHSIPSKKRGNFSSISAAMTYIMDPYKTLFRDQDFSSSDLLGENLSIGSEFVRAIHSQQLPNGIQITPCWNRNGTVVQFAILTYKEVVKMNREAQFTVFCMESYNVYKALTGKQVLELFEKYGVFEYIHEFFDVLHTTGYQFINHDIDIYLKARNAIFPA